MFKIMETDQFQLWFLSKSVVRSSTPWKHVGYQNLTLEP